jgi:divalent metal cation (Fe/Co/Zn/Cd) transporter
MNSASLLAEAGHSLSDLLGVCIYVSGFELSIRSLIAIHSVVQDFVTLATWKISRRPPSPDYPWGFGKYETVGTLGVSLILVGGAIGIGLHSYHVSGSNAILYGRVTEV